uniref:Pericentrin n=1 Tax=Macrostomum lignano TaxID=282301 RepID=A0A1I8FAD0_9PLAT
SETLRHKRFGNDEIRRYRNLGTVPEVRTLGGLNRPTRQTAAYQPETTARGARTSPGLHARPEIPSHYACVLWTISRTRPDLPPGLVKDSPTSRQDAILLQLSTIRQGLLDKQKEIETSLSVS